MHFQLRIELGNEAMSAAQDIGCALIELGETLHSWQDDNWVGTAGNIRDTNGNTVGRWELVA